MSGFTDGPDVANPSEYPRPSHFEVTADTARKHAGRFHGQQEEEYDLHLVASFLEYMVVPDNSYNVGVVSTTRRAELDVPPNVPSRSRPRG